MNILKNNSDKTFRVIFKCSDSASALNVQNISGEISKALGVAMLKNPNLPIEKQIINKAGDTSPYTLGIQSLELEIDIRAKSPEEAKRLIENIVSTINKEISSLIALSDVLNKNKDSKILLILKNIISRAKNWKTSLPPNALAN